MSKTYAIYATDGGNVFGLNGSIPWKCREDLAHFKKTTTGHIVIMGYKTFKSMENIVLSDRIVVVISKSALPDGTLVFSDIWHAIEYCKNAFFDKSIFVIGGSDLITTALASSLVDSIICTNISSVVTRIRPEDTVVFGPTIPSWYQLISTKDLVEGVTVNYYEKVTHKRADSVYRGLVKLVTNSGSYRTDRTGTGTLSVFGTCNRYNLTGGRIPLLSSKLMSFSIIAEELLWFVSGSTDSSKLSSKIWKQNTSREFLDSRGLTSYKQGLIGPAYGFQWRHYGAGYDNEHGSPTDPGYDQLGRVINLLKTDPYSRRIIITAWNPEQLDKMALEPCHILAQFYVTDADPFDPDTRKWLSCDLYQRSGDIGLGVPYNVVSYSLLTYMVAGVVGMRPREFIHCIGDAHIYKNHVSSLKAQVDSYKGAHEATIEIVKKDSIDAYTLDDFKVEYVAGPKVSMAMAV